VAQAHFVRCVLVATQRTHLHHAHTETKLQMATRDELFPSKYLKAGDVETPLIVTIDRAPTETVGQGAKAESKPVLYFRGGSPKPCPVNKTNFDALVAVSGEEDSDNWGGTVVELFAIDVMGPNGPTRGVRMRRPKTTKSRTKAADVELPARDGEQVPF
jgi:hypothetical protein